MSIYREGTTKNVNEDRIHLNVEKITSSGIKTKEKEERPNIESINFNPRDLLEGLKLTKIIQESDDEEAEKEIQLYADHVRVIKDEIVIGPEVLQHSVYNTIGSQDLIHSESSSKASEPSKNQDSSDQNISPTVELETETMSVVGQDLLEELYADNEIVIVPVVMQTVTNVMGKKDVLQHNRRRERKAKLKKANEKIKRVTRKYTKRNPQIVKDAPELTGLERSRLEKEDQNQKETTKSNVEERTNQNVDTYKITCINNQTNENIKRPTKKSKKFKHAKKLKHEILMKDKYVKPVRSPDLSTCNNRGNHFDTKRNLLMHIQSHENIKEKVGLQIDKKRHKGGICDYKTDAFANLTSHSSIHVDDEKPFSCYKCEFKCRSREYLTHHIRIHTGKQPYSCSMCEFSCRSKEYMTYHLRIHTSEQLYYFSNITTE